MELRLSVSRDAEIFGEYVELGLPMHVVRTYNSHTSAATSLLRLPAVRYEFLRYLCDQRIETVVCTMSHLWNVAMLSGIQRAGTRFVLTVHDAQPHPGENYLIRRWLLTREVGAADGIVALTETVRNAVCDLYSYPRERTWVVPHGVFSYYRAIEPRTFPSRRPFRMLFFGRLLPYKGLDKLIAAYRDIRAAYPLVTLTIVGRGDIDPYRGLLDSCPDVRVDNRWIPESEIGRFFEAADLLVAPYTEASQSGVIATAYAAAVPAVVTPVGGLAEQVRHGETGLVAEEVSAWALAEAIRALLDDPVLYERCSRGALAEAEGNLAWPAVAARFAEAIERVACLPMRGRS